MGSGIEEGTLKDLVPVGLRLAVEEKTYHAVALTIERGEEEDEYAEDGTGDEEALPRGTKATELILKPVHDTGEIERNEAAEYT